ncbi:MAG: hydrogenase maturation factor [Lachnospiraceae bacterium]|nr:hydrogenase maturation factor [Lachnospiraceae bacterium]
MNCGKWTQSVYERSVSKVIRTNSIENRKFYDGAGLRADCAILAGDGADSPGAGGIVSGQALASGRDRKVVVRAYLAAVNHVIACSANREAAGLQYAHASITVTVPEKLREIKVRGMVEAAAVQAEETGIPILACNVQVLQAAAEPIVTCVVSAGLENKSETNLVPLRKKALADEDIVMTKWLGLEGTAVIAQRSFERLGGRYPADLVEEAADFYRYLSVVPEAATAVKSGAGYLHAVREGGIFGGLWELAAANGVGLVADLKRIPIRQETIEVCEFFDLNPYELLAGGSLLIVTPNGGELVQELMQAGVPAAVIGRTTQGNDRIIRHGEETRFLEPADGDQIHIYHKKAEECFDERTDIIHYRKEQQD